MALWLVHYCRVHFICPHRSLRWPELQHVICASCCLPRTPVYFKEYERAGRTRRCRTEKHRSQQKSLGEHFEQPTQMAGGGYDESLSTPIINAKLGR